MSFFQFTEEHFAKIQNGGAFNIEGDGYILRFDRYNHFPYVMFIPEGLGKDVTIVLCSNNFETSDRLELFAHAVGDCLDIGLLFKDLPCPSPPVLMPILPSAGVGTSPYWQQLSIDCFSIMRDMGLDRPDSCIIDCIEGAGAYLEKECDVHVNDKVFLCGYSSSGVFASRFCLLHPELVDSALIGGSSCDIPVPWDDKDQDWSVGYPFGISDIGDILLPKGRYRSPFFNDDDGRFDFDAYKAAYKSVNFRYFVADREYDRLSDDRYLFDEDALAEHRFVEVRDEAHLSPMHDMICMARSVPFDVRCDIVSRFGQDVSRRIVNLEQFVRDNMGISLPDCIIVENCFHSDADFYEFSKSGTDVSGLGASERMMSEGRRLFGMMYADTCVRYEEKLRQKEKQREAEDLVANVVIPEQHTTSVMGRLSRLFNVFS